ncbi:glycerate kinase [Halobacillus sp. A1]|uniref:glycerate kinase n=1 Tax=Halobacillus sp. A1 TaxID=2880262 RepID=UPI0020A6AC69|nr:glycerate kinase [Halobacillus sp. A1]MCP3030097.1 glycerate kinase [Halobacillus sp. A1]
MKVLFAPDSFKGSMSSTAASKVMERAFQSVDPLIETAIKPMADGGEGTLSAMVNAIEGDMVELECTGPLGERRTAGYLEIGSKTAVIEGAEIAGLPLVPEEQKNPDYTTTYGIGEVILHALDRGNKKLVLALGGSSSNDGGLGVFQALGMRAYDADGQTIGCFGKDVMKVDSVDFTSLDPRLKDTTIRVACDVDNPLTGSHGATYVYGPQKGATEKQVEEYDQALEHFGRLVEEALGGNFSCKKGAGAAGGLGFAFLALGGRLYSGAELVSDAIQLEEAVKNSDMIITGEGQSDVQTLYGKAPGYVAKLAKENGKPVILLSGSLDGPMNELNTIFSGCFSIVPGPRSLGNCIENGEEYLFEACRQMAHLIWTFLQK